MPQIEFIENIFDTCLVALSQFLVYQNRLSVMWNSDKWPILVVLKWNGILRLVLILTGPRIEIFLFEAEGMTTGEWIYWHDDGQRKWRTDFKS